MSQADLDWVPVACTLPTVEQPLRAAEFDDLFASHLDHVDRLGPTHARLLLTGDPGLTQRVQALADRETECCSFFAFTVTPSSTSKDAVELDVRVPDAYAEVLAALVSRAEISRQPRGAGIDADYWSNSRCPVISWCGSTTRPFSKTTMLS